MINFGIFLLLEIISSVFVVFNNWGFVKVAICTVKFGEIFGFKLLLSIKKIIIRKRGKIRRII